MPVAATFQIAFFKVQWLVEETNRVSIISRDIMPIAFDHVRSHRCEQLGGVVFGKRTRDVRLNHANFANGFFECRES